MILQTHDDCTYAMGLAGGLFLLTERNLVFIIVENVRMFSVAVCFCNSIAASLINTVEYFCDTESTSAALKADRLKEKLVSRLFS